MVGMEYQRGCMMMNGREKSIHDQLGRMIGQQAESDNLPAIQIDYRGQIEPLPAVSDMSEITGPDLIRSEGKVGVKQIREG